MQIIYAMSASFLLTFSIIAIFGASFFKVMIFVLLLSIQL